MTLDLEKIKKAIYEYAFLLEKKTKLEKRMIQLAGKDPGQEFVLLQRFQQVAALIALIDTATDTEQILTPRESYVVYRKSEGATTQELAETLGVSTPGVNNIFERACKKISQAAGESSCTV